jgi:hypothetical protein
MRALTLQQPYATAICPGPKRTENRPKATVRMPLPKGGLWLGLHAGKTWYPGGLEAVRRLWPAMPNPAEMPLGVLLGVFHLYAVVAYPTRGAFPLYPPTDPHHLLGNPWAFGPWCLLIGEVLPLDELIPCRGMLGCWRIPESIEGPLLRLLPTGANT